MNRFPWMDPGLQIISNNTLSHRWKEVNEMMTGVLQEGDTAWQACHEL